jgi:hypothetical protein
MPPVTQARLGARAVVLSWLRRAVAVAGLLALLAATPAAAVRESRRVRSRGDVMRMLFTADVPKEIDPFAHVVDTRPGALDLAGPPRAPAEPKSLPPPADPGKGLLPGKRTTRVRRRKRRRA